MQIKYEVAHTPGIDPNRKVIGGNHLTRDWCRRAAITTQQRTIFPWTFLVLAVAREKSAFQNMFSGKVGWKEDYNGSAGISNNIGLLSEDAAMATNI